MDQNYQSPDGWKVFKESVKQARQNTKSVKKCNHPDCARINNYGQLYCYQHRKVSYDKKDHLAKQ